MSLFHEYVGKPLGPQQLEKERKKQLDRIEKARGSRVLAYCARMGGLPPNVDPSVTFEDLLPFADVLRGLDGPKVSVIIETLGGVGEVGRQMVEMLHDKFTRVEFLVPGMAMSTGTIMCLGGHEILMGPASALGPIDAQLWHDGKRFSADALLEGFEAIKREVTANNGQLNAAYIPVLQRLSPGEIQNAQNTLEFARATVTEWLAKYKFADWVGDDGLPVDDKKKTERAREIAEQLSKQSNWHTHGRSLRIEDLRKLRVKITDYSADPELSDALMRYQVLVRLTLEVGNAYKIYETRDANITRRFPVAVSAGPVAPGVVMPQNIDNVEVTIGCVKCGTQQRAQLDFVPGQVLQPGRMRYPNVPTLPCPTCKQPIDFATIRAGVEQQLGRKALTPQPTK